MTPEELRAEILRDIDGIFARPWVALTMSAGQKRLLRAQRDYWRDAGTAELQKLLDAVSREP